MKPFRLLLAAVLLVVVSVIYRKDLRLGEDAEEKEQKKISLSKKEADAELAPAEEEAAAEEKTEE